jgi:hypothetical protein
MLLTEGVKWDEYVCRDFRDLIVEWFRQRSRRGMPNDALPLGSGYIPVGLLVGAAVRSALIH